MTPDAYLARIGLREAPTTDLAGLTALMRAHLRTVPFENLSIHLAEPVSLEVDALLDKIVVRRRGGFCYELNGAFAWLLRQLGFEVTVLAAKVYGDPGPGPPFDHLTLVVGLDEPWLADVGFGRFVDAPVRFAHLAPQHDEGAGLVTFAPADHGDLDVLIEGVPQLRVERRPRELVEFEATCWYQQTSPHSHFATSLVCSLATDGGRVTLSDRTLTVTDAAGRREQVLGDDAEVLAAYRDHFGIVLDRLPTPPGRLT